MAEITLARFTKAQLRFTTLSQESLAGTGLVFAHVRTLNLKRDDEHSFLYALWLFQNGIFRYPNKIYQPPHQIYIAWDKQSGKLLGIAGITPDDQNVGKEHGYINTDPFFFGFFAGHNVHYEYRNRGIGQQIIAHRKNALQLYANDLGKSLAVYAVSINPISNHNMETAGFENLGERYVTAEKRMKWIFRLQVNPLQAG